MSDASYSESEGGAPYPPPPPGYGREYAPPPEAYDTQEQNQAAAWVDGYGREHYATTPQADSNAALLSPEDRHTRRHPWHGWNSDCDER